MRMMLVGAGAVGECILKVLKKRDPKGEWLEYVLITDYSEERFEEALCVFSSRPAHSYKKRDKCTKASVSLSFYQLVIAT